MAESNVLISIIMPCFNAGRYLGRALDSALGQSFLDIELIVVNDGSSDGSTEILANRKDSRLKIIEQHNQGVCSARNRGIEEACGKYLAFLDADDTWDQHCLQKLYAKLSSCPDAVLAYCGWQNVGLSGGAGDPFVPPEYEGPDKAARFLTNCPWPIHGALTRKDAIIDAGGFDLRYPTSEDYLLWLKVALSRPAVRVPEVLAYYHFHNGTQATSDRQGAALNQWQVKRDFLAKNPSVADQIGRKKVRELTDGQLLKAGFVCYWDRDLEPARAIFRKSMLRGYGTAKEWTYMAPSLLPYAWHERLIRFADGN